MSILPITPDNAQTIADMVSKATFELLPSHNNISEAEFKLAERKALLSLGYQPSVYHRKMNEIWELKPWYFKTWMEMHDDDYYY